MSATITGPDEKPRCRWCGAAPEFLHYHDTEWGFSVGDDWRLFEKLSLEGFQSGLSWRTILSKRRGFRIAFHDFEFERIARFSERDVERLLKDKGIVRPRGKIEAVINNARCAVELASRPILLGVGTLLLRVLSPCRYAIKCQRGGFPQRNYGPERNFIRL